MIPSFVGLKRPSISEAVIKIRTFCNYRDRCHKEVRDKLYAMGLFKKEVDQVLMQMIDEDLLNEERFARSFARGYFRTKQWGRYKIERELQQRQIHARLIDTAMTEIDEEEYQATVRRLIEKKLKTTEGKPLERKQKVSDYLMRKGYTYAEFKSALEEKGKCEAP